MDRVVRETGEFVFNGFEEIYINANARDESEISDLMAIFMEENAYDLERFPKTSESKKRYKEGEGKMMNEEVNAIIRQIVDYEVAEQMAAKTAEIDKQLAEQMAKKEAEYQAERSKEQAEISRLKAALQEALSKVPK